jgi:MoCo/4Fe-4S cofactor protein with predicted Tat translocation signal
MKHHSTKRDYWRSLEHLADSPEMRNWADKEFPGYDPEDMKAISGPSRRRFLQLMSASLALAGVTLTGCRRWPEEKLAPYTVRPKGQMPGVPEQYATVMELNGVASPLLVTSFDGRPIKVEGNPTHPFSQTVAGKQGAATAIAQASVLDLYDPRRSTKVTNGYDTDKPSEPKTSDFETFATELKRLVKSPGDGEKLAVLIESTSSPSTARLKELCLKKLPKASWYEYEPLSWDNESAGIKLATGQPGRTMLHLDKASLVVSFDCDFLGAHPAQIRYASDWAVRRRSADSEKEMSRVYVLESAFTLTGSVADIRLPTTTSHLLGILAKVAGQLLHPEDNTSKYEEDAFVGQIVADINSHRGGAVVVVGAHLPPEAHQLALKINSALGAVGSAEGSRVSLYQDPAGDRLSHFDAIAELSKKINAKDVETLLILGGNPAYDAPADLDFKKSLKDVPNSIHLGLNYNETAELCMWHVPRAHYLEAWGDARAWDGTASVVQPLIEPIFGGKTIDEILAIVCDSPETTSDAIVRKTFAGLLGSGDSDLEYRKVLNDGLLKESGFKTIGELKPAVPASLPSTTQPTPAAPAGTGQGFEVRFLQSGVYDGRFASNAWLQEMPDTLTKLVWDNAALISKKDADDAGITTGDMVSLSLGGKSLPIVAYVLPGQPVGVIGLPLGYGRTSAGPIGSGVGFNTYQLRSLANPYYAPGATLSKIGETYDLATTQNHQLMDSVGLKGLEERVGYKGENAELIREATLVEYKADPNLFKRKPDGSLALQLFDPPMNFRDPHAWGMAVDMSSCIGCNACVIACQAENNIPVVGKDNVEQNRQMHWIRIDRYFKGDQTLPGGASNDPNPEVVYQPVMCQHCENAPCEQVCPVGATMHDSEGLNVMVYNRCIGTRYCSNNCPYKVRRFNYLDYQSQDPRHDKYPPPYLGIPDQQQLEQVDKIKRMVFNPEVTVRMRGVMEKCTYCIQRIHAATIDKRGKGEDVADGEILTACQQTCPTQAIVFGNLNDPEARVSKLQQNLRAYSLLADLDNRPRTQYLGKVRNPVA